MVKQIIKEAMEKNPIGLKEAVEAELMERLALALEMKKKSYAEEELEEARKKDWDYEDEEKELMKKAEAAGIELVHREKYERGKKAQGPRMPRKDNVERLTRALKDGKNKVPTVVIWRG